MQIDLNPLLQNVRKTVASHRIAPGQYTRFTLGTRRSNPYGCADAANILYSLGDFPAEPEDQAAAVSALQDFQEPETGLFHDVAESDFYCHHPYHTTAHCTAALQLLNARPRHRLTVTEKYLDFAETEKLIEGLDWTGNPWSDSHQGAGIYSALVNTGRAGAAWRDRFFDCMDAHADPEYGMSWKGAPQTGKRPLRHHLNGWFHYLFCYNHANRPFPYPEKLIDTCLALPQTPVEDDAFGENVGFQEIDWVFPLNRAIRQTAYRADEVRKALDDFAVKYVTNMTRIDPATDRWFDDLHSLFGMICCISELYLALPGRFKAEKPLRNVLDSRPFI